MHGRVSRKSLELTIFIIVSSCQLKIWPRFFNPPLPAPDPTMALPSCASSKNDPARQSKRNKRTSPPESTSKSHTEEVRGKKTSKNSMCRPCRQTIHLWEHVEMLSYTTISKGGGRRCFDSASELTQFRDPSSAKTPKPKVKLGVAWFEGGIHPKTYPP